MPYARMRTLAAAGVFVCCLAVYGTTLLPTVPGGDAGELVVAAQHRAVAHPPGYPLWTVLAWLFSLVPAGSVAWRVAWLSAVATSGAAAAIFACVAAHDSRGRVAGALLAAGLFAFSPTVWTYAVGAEVFPLHAFFVALLFLLALAWNRSRDPRAALAIAFMIGVALSHHHTIVFYAAPIGAWLLWTGRHELLTPRVLPRLAIAGIAGLVPYAYLFAAGSAESPYSWGDTGSIGGFVDHLLRRDYGTFQLLPPGHAASSSWPAKLAAYTEHFARASLWIGLGLAAIAVIARRSAFTALVASCALFYVGAFHALANVAVGDPFLRGVLERFWIQADVAMAILAGIGFTVVAVRLPPAAAAIAVAVLLVARGGLSAGERLDRGGGVVEHYGRAILEPLAPGTLLLTQGDLITNVARYLQSAEGVRPDVVVLDQELLTKPWYVRRMAKLHPGVAFPGDRYHPAEPGGFSMRAFLDANSGRESIAIYPGWKSGDPTVEGHWKAWPDGLALRVRPGTNAPHGWILQSNDALAKVDALGWPPMDRYAPGTWERVALEDVWQARHRRAVVVLEQAIARGNDQGLLTIARGELEASGRVHPDPPAALFRNLGIVYSRLAGSNRYLRRDELAAWQKFLEKADAGDPDRATIEKAVREIEDATGSAGGGEAGP